MTDLYKKIIKTAFLGGLLSCVGLLVASINLCEERGSKYVMIIAIIINSVCATINIQHFVKYKRKIKEESERCSWCIQGRYCFKNDMFCLDSKHCPDRSSEVGNIKE